MADRPTAREVIANVSWSGGQIGLDLGSKIIAALARAGLVICSASWFTSTVKDAVAKERDRCELEVLRTMTKWGVGTDARQAVANAAAAIRARKE